MSRFNELNSAFFQFIDSRRNKNQTKKPKTELCKYCGLVNVLEQEEEIANQKTTEEHSTLEIGTNPKRDFDSQHVLAVYTFPRRLDDTYMAYILESLYKLTCQVLNFVSFKQA
ncbi:hypothetical protein AVEN_49159-1 [Araneus ventricosus]|uniref:Uncharacterized protein n=1 Tax=Araneus ventricosus TaxID=182803 RepID=A0A4Y2C1L6_ARAVE|nr:hypothetical protein AVEN_49159-1 [Araneus ventricosus]